LVLLLDVRQNDLDRDGDLAQLQLPLLLEDPREFLRNGVIQWP